MQADVARRVSNVDLTGKGSDSSYVEYMSIAPTGDWIFGEEEIWVNGCYPSNHRRTRWYSIRGTHTPVTIDSTNTCSSMPTDMSNLRTATFSDNGDTLIAGASTDNTGGSGIQFAKYALGATVTEVGSRVFVDSLVAGAQGAAMANRIGMGEFYMAYASSASLLNACPFSLQGRTHAAPYTRFTTFSTTSCFTGNGSAVRFGGGAKVTKAIAVSRETARVERVKYLARGRAQ